jgi:hypothetical protein
LREDDSLAINSVWRSLTTGGSSLREGGFHHGRSSDRALSASRGCTSKLTEPIGCAPAPLHGTREGSGPAQERGREKDRQEGLAGRFGSSGVPRSRARLPERSRQDSQLNMAHNCVRSRRTGTRGGSPFSMSASRLRGNGDVCPERARFLMTITSLHAHVSAKRGVRPRRHDPICMGQTADCGGTRTFMPTGTSPLSAGSSLWPIDQPAQVPLRGAPLWRPQVSPGHRLQPRIRAPRVFVWLASAGFGAAGGEGLSRAPSMESAGTGTCTPVAEVRTDVSSKVRNSPSVGAIRRCRCPRMSADLYQRWSTARRSKNWR